MVMPAIELTQKQKDDICEAVIENFSLEKAYTKGELPTTPPTIWKYAHKDKEFGKDLERARQIGISRFLDEALEIAYNTEGDIYGTNKDGRPKISYECVNRSKVKIDTIFRTMAMIDPERYNEAFYKPKDRRIKLKKALTSAVSDRVEALYSELEKGRITPEEGMKISSILQVQVNVVDNQKVMEELKLLKDKIENANLFTKRV